MDIKTLVDLVVARARVDKTAPDPANPQNGWRTDALFQDIDAFVVIGNKNPTTYAEIGWQVLAKVQDLPEMAVLAQLAVLRGERLLAATPERESFIFKFAQEVENDISVLPVGTRKMRCKSLFEYNMGIFYEAYSHFDLAVKSHARAAEEADLFGDKPGAAISRFMEKLCLLKNASCTGMPYAERQAIFSDLEKKHKQLIEALRGSALEVQWTENGRLHMLAARTLLDAKCS